MSLSSITQTSRIPKKEEEEDCQIQEVQCSSQEEKGEECSKVKKIAKNPYQHMTYQQKKEVIFHFKRQLKLKNLRQFRKKYGKKKLSFLRMDFFPSILYNSDVFMYKTPEYINLAPTAVCNGKNYLAINDKPCPLQACQFVIKIERGAVRLGFVTDNTLTKLTQKSSITVCTRYNRIKIGNQYQKLSTEITKGMTVKLRVSVQNQKFRLYIQDKKQLTCDFPPCMIKCKTIYFYVDLLYSGDVKLMLK